MSNHDDLELALRKLGKKCGLLRLEFDDPLNRWSLVTNYGVVGQHKDWEKLLDAANEQVEEWFGRPHGKVYVHPDE